jgi:proteasome accessory factor B
MAGPRIDRTERLLNLVFALMGSAQPVSRAAIAASIPGYDPTAGQAAFERMFERDKDELRSLGIPIRTVLDVNGDVSGYSIDRDDYALPEIRFTASERSVLALAASAWQNALLRSSASAGLRKLEADSASGIENDLASGFVARINAADTSLLVLLGCLRARSSVTFEYQSPKADSASTRHVDPWGLVAQDGGWYLVGFDRHRTDTRAFRLSRIRGQVSSAGAVENPAPDNCDVRALIDPAARSALQVNATVRVKAGAGAALRRLSVDHLASDATGDLKVSAPDVESLRSAVLFAGDGVSVLEPLELRDDIVSTLTRIRDKHAESHA